ncbi:MAG: type II toxin-antitoxin system VapC family toxin [Verrucomicrobia bacterium]|nr:type II toxin-antitoxin system VapC family toxin [Verrucomicrobiota bacterium]
MIETVALDAGPLERLAHPARNREIATWLERLLLADVTVAIPDLLDYEVRRSFLLEGLTISVDRLDSLRVSLKFLAINSEAMLKAAELWANVRRRGLPTADPKELDGDVILAAQALQIDATVATENVGHLSLFVSACNWKSIGVE